MGVFGNPKSFQAELPIASGADISEYKRVYRQIDLRDFLVKLDLTTEWYLDKIRGILPKRKWKWNIQLVQVHYLACRHYPEILILMSPCPEPVVIHALHLRTVIEVEDIDSVESLFEDVLHLLHTVVGRAYKVAYL